MIHSLRFYLLGFLRLLAVWFCFAAGLKPCAAVSGWSHAEPGLSVEFSDPLGGKSSGGFLVLSLAFENTTRKEVSLRLNVTFDGRFRSDGGSVSSQVQLPTGKGRRQALVPSPYVDGLGSRILVQCVGPTVTTQQHLFTQRAGNDGTAPFAIAGQESDRYASDLSKKFASSESPWTHSPPPLAGRFEGKVPKIQRSSEGDFPVFANLPQVPWGFSSIAGLWVEGAEWNAAPESLRAAVRNWVRAGGRLFVMSGEHTAFADLPPELSALGPGLGLGRVALHERLSTFALKAFSDTVISLDDNPFPGRVEDYAEWKSQLLPPFEVDVRWLLGFLLGFLVLLLPVNFLWLAPLQKRQRVFITVPTISLLAGLGLVLVAVWTDGTGGTGIRNGLVLLGDEKEGAVLYQEQLSRTGMVSSSSFSLPEDATFVVCKMDRHNAFRSLRSGLETAGDWFSSRSIQGHTLQRWFPSDAGVVLQSGSDGSPVLVASGFAPEGPVFYADKRGEYWTAPRLVTGAPVALVRSTTKDFEDWFLSRITEPSSNLQARMREALQRREWFFAAVGGGADFWIPTLSQVRWLRDQMVCLGPVRKEVRL